MIELVQANWLLVVIALVIGIAVAWFVFVGSRRTRVDSDRSDVLDEGHGPAARNQALIDAPTAVEAAPSPPIEDTAAEHPTPAPAAPAEPAIQATAPATPEDGDDLTRIKGLGPKLVQLLAGLGVTRFAQIAAWDEAEIDRIDSQLGRFEGRIRRDDWVTQARLLAADDRSGYEERFGKL